MKIRQGYKVKRNTRIVNTEGLVIIVFLTNGYMIFYNFLKYSIKI